MAYTLVQLHASRLFYYQAVYKNPSYRPLLCKQLDPYSIDMSIDIPIQLPSARNFAENPQESLLL